MTEKKDNISASLQQAAQNMEKKAETSADDRRQAFLLQVLTPEARERLSRVHLVKDSKAREVEDNIMSMIQRGQFVGKITEEQLIAMLEKAQTKSTSKVTIQRKKNAADDNDDIEYDV
eukprot:TRINITY_DN5755_c0_g1_i1.p1 TRINITY_DN5755_c0_g1~~TRINITY_DN5755_c0_g1_i1.p1  ORF type:complete len:134 (-),score=42.46 TRINITY_DN5755_c0_g1_i1:8-361(-)